MSGCLTMREFQAAKLIAQTKQPDNCYHMVIASWMYFEYLYMRAQANKHLYLCTKDINHTINIKGYGSWYMDNKSGVVELDETQDEGYCCKECNTDEYVTCIGLIEDFEELVESTNG